jgi:hypothetical protein
MDTVVEEKPLSFATSRMVTIAGALRRTKNEVLASAVIRQHSRA